MVEETTYFSDDTGIRVTSSRVIIGNTTYSLANITSVSRTINNPSRVGPFVFIVTGVLILVASLSGESFGLSIIGAILAGLGTIAWRGLRPTYHLRIRSASGDSIALTSENKDRIDQVVRAINEAIIQRG